jgi:hypothetical protein
MAGKIIADHIEHSTAGSLDTQYVVNGSSKAWATQTTHGGAFLGSFNYSSSTDISEGVATYTFTNSMDDANYSVNATHYNRAAGSADPSHHTSSSHRTSWWITSAGAVGDISEKGSIQVCGDLA